MYFVATSSISKENSIEVIHLDILRTFPTLCFFQEVIGLLCMHGVFIRAVYNLLQGGPLHHVLHDVLGAYVCYRPDVGYVSATMRMYVHRYVCMYIHLKSIIIL